MASFQVFFRNYLEDKLNTTQNNLLTPEKLKYKIFNRYGIQDQDFFDVVVDSVDWEVAPEFSPQFLDYTLNTDFFSLAALNEGGEEFKVPKVLYELSQGSSSYYVYWDNIEKKYFQVDAFAPPYNAYPVNQDYDRLSELIDAGDVYYRYVWWDKDFVNSSGEPDGKYVVININDEPYNGYVVNEEFDFLNALISLGIAEQRPLTVYRLLIEEIVWRVGNPADFEYLEFNSETGSYVFINPETQIFSQDVPSKNIVVEFEGEEYNTQLGNYNLQQIRYIPAIIEDFIAEFEPLSFVKNANYTIPVTFYVNETIDRELNNIIVDAIQNFQDVIRGRVDTYFDDVAGSDFTFLITHGGYSPLTGIIDFNGTVFREYQLILSLELIDKGFFTNQIEYVLSVPEFQGTDPEVERFAGLGTPFRVFPVSAMSSRASELHQFQKFSTSTEDTFEVKALANEVGFMMELSFLYDGSLFTRFLYKLRYTPLVPKVITLQVKYPGLTSSLETPDTIDYLIESIGGLETVGEKIIFSLVLKPIDPVQFQISLGNVNTPFPVEEEEEEITQTFAVTVQNVDGVNVYFIDDVERPELVLSTGNVFVFDQSDSTNSGHPLAFRGASNVPYNNGVVSTGTPGTAGAKTTFTVPFNVPSTLRYYCTVHGNAMGNTITFGAQ